MKKKVQMQYIYFIKPSPFTIYEKDTIFSLFTPSHERAQSPISISRNKLSNFEKMYTLSFLTIQSSIKQIKHHANLLIKFIN